MKVSPVVAGKKSTALAFDLETSLKFLEDGENRPKKHGVIRIINQEDGDKRLVWDSELIAEINEARRIFNELLSQGFMPFMIDPRTSQPTKVPMTEFDPMAEQVFMEEREIVMAPVHMAVGG